jgi:hypothetical protein
MESLSASPVGRWRNPRLIVRTMIALVLITGAGVGWLIRSARIQRETVLALQKNGGAVNYNWEVIDGKPIPDGKPPVPRWLVDLVGIDYFGHVRYKANACKDLDRRPKSRFFRRQVEVPLA